ncbi:response regulator [bacterium]|nr:response regulator [bacterium]
MCGNLKVLIVEDEYLTAKCIFHELKDLDTDPLNPVAKGELAVQVALNEKPDLILMDIRLAGKMDGIEAAQKIKNQIDIPVVFFSGYATEQIVKKAKTVNYLEFHEKPVTIGLLKSIIDRLKVQIKERKSL